MHQTKTRKGSVDRVRTVRGEVEERERRLDLHLLRGRIQAGDQARQQVVHVRKQQAPVLAVDRNIAERRGAVVLNFSVVGRAQQADKDRQTTGANQRGSILVGVRQIEKRAGGVAHNAQVIRVTKLYERRQGARRDDLGFVGICQGRERVIRSRSNMA